MTSVVLAAVANFVFLFMQSSLRHKQLPVGGIKLDGKK